MRRAAGRRDIAQRIADGEAAGCGGKRIYESFKVAETLAKRQRRSRDCTVEAYRCRTCRHYHIGETKDRQGLPRMSKSRPRQKEIDMRNKPKPKPMKPTKPGKPKPGC